MKIAVIDGQGGGIGKAILEKLSKALNDMQRPNDVDYLNTPIELIALGTNNFATSAMVKSGAKQGITGEKAILSYVHQVDLIAGPIAAVIANTMKGEITLELAETIASCAAIKILIPLNRCNLVVAGTTHKKLDELIESAVEEILKFIKGK